MRGDTLPLFPRGERGKLLRGFLGRGDAAEIGLQARGIFREEFDLFLKARADRWQPLTKCVRGRWRLMSIGAMRGIIIDMTVVPLWRGIFSASRMRAKTMSR